MERERERERKRKSEREREKRKEVSLITKPFIIGISTMFLLMLRDRSPSRPSSAKERTFCAAQTSFCIVKIFLFGGVGAFSLAKVTSREIHGKAKQRVAAFSVI